MCNMYTFILIQGERRKNENEGNQRELKGSPTHGISPFGLKIKLKKTIKTERLKKITK